jgi:predicted pyridoxine 5'-phosphate oxidase superfamily flavin-nucleotide-binding protein
MSDWPFHPGELEAQVRAGGGSSGGGIRDFMVDQHRIFFEALPFVVVGSVDEGWPVAAVLAGDPGFVAAPDPWTLRISAPLDRSDPAHRPLVAGAQVGVLGIDLATRRRNRANGFLTSAEGGNLVVEVRQSFGNCPRYIQRREVRRASNRPHATERLNGLDRGAVEAISAADTFFIASAARVGQPAGGVDISHRGGPPGFVQVEGDTLTIPDFKGNRYFNTLGNLVSNPRAALLFVDFERGDLLHLRGTTGIVWDGPEVRRSPGAERLWRFKVIAAWRKRGALPLRWTLRDTVRNSPSGVPGLPTTSR